MKKTLFSILILLGLVSNQVQTLDVRDEHGRTILMSFIIRAEQEIKYIKADIDRLWHACYEYERVYDGVDVTVHNNVNSSQSTHVKSQYKYKLVRRASCTDRDIYAHKERKQDLANMITQTIYAMNFMAGSEDLYINAKDSQGYTAQNYCYTYEIYQELRRQGAVFQYIPYMYFNPVYGTVSTAAIALGTYLVVGGIGAGIAYGINNSSPYRYHSNFY